MRISWLQRYTSLGVLLMLGIGVHSQKDQDPMLAAESATNYMTGVRYLNEPEANSYMELLKRSASLATPTKIAPRASSSAFFTRSGTLEQSEPGEIYKKAASEYWNSEVPNHGDSLEDQSDYGYSQQSQGFLGGGSGMGYQKGKEISVTPDHKPITLHYRTHAQPIMVHQTRIPGPKPEVKYSQSHEAPHRVVHQVVRPIVQEVHEIIQPFRRVVQQVQPVIEEIKTVVAKDSGKGVGGAGYGGAAGYGKAGLAYDESKLMYQRAALYDAQKSGSQPYGSMALPSNVVPRRSKVFLNKDGIPVYQSNYMGPAFVRS